MAARRSKVVLRFRPASTRMRVPPAATNVEFPALLDARMQTLTMDGLPDD
jgi:hypothetical protein